MSRYVIRGPLTVELALKDSPIRRFFDDRLGMGLKDLQAEYRSAAGPMLVAGVPPDEANAGTIGTAADWLLRMLVHPSPSLLLAANGASLCGMLPALRELAAMLGYRDSGAQTFAGPGRGSSVAPDLLYRACWGLALLTEAYRRGLPAAASGPLGQLGDKSARSLLDVAPGAGLDQLAALRDPIETRLLRALGARHGLWAVGPVFAASKIMAGDADLIAGGLLIELKTTIKKPSLSVTDLWQVLGYAFMDYTDKFGISEVALFSARYGYLAQWNLDMLLLALAGRPVTVPEMRGAFRALLEACR